MSNIPKQAYWNGNGRYETEAKPISALVPTQSEATKGSPVELYRLACNAYYDLYNNGMGNASHRLAPFIEALKAYRSKGILATQDHDEKILWEDVAMLEGFYEMNLEAEAAYPIGDSEEDEWYDRVEFPDHKSLYLPMERLMDAIILYASGSRHPESPDLRLSPSL